MANKDRPRGFKPTGVLLRATEYTASAAIYPGDPVALAASGKVARSAGSALIGVALGYAAADGDKILVADHPDQQFVAQSDSALADISVVGGNYDITLGTANTAYKVSTAEIDGDTADAATEATNAIKILALSPEVGNDWGADCDVICKINNHQLAGGTGSAAV